MRPSGWRWPAWRTPTTELSAWLAEAYRQLAQVSENPTLEAQLLLAHVLNQPRSWVVAHSERRMTPDQGELANRLLKRLLKREPLAYILGKTEFYGLTLAVSPDVLIPRPETELLVEAALRWLRGNPQWRQAVDIGTGSGAIAAALAVNVPDLRVLAVDRSPQALGVANRNLEQLGVSDRVRLAEGDLLEGVDGPFELVCANLPYIPSDTLEGLDVLRYEPRLALDGGPDGLRLIERLLSQLVVKGFQMALLEIESRQGEAALLLAQRYLPGAHARVVKDMAGHDRLLVIENGQESGASTGWR